MSQGNGGQRKCALNKKDQQMNMMSRIKKKNVQNTTLKHGQCLDNPLNYRLVWFTPLNYSVGPIYPSTRFCVFVSPHSS